MEWKTDTNLVEYADALDVMERRVADIRAGDADEYGWFLEHPPIYTAGTSADEKDLLAPQFPVFKTGRGGQYTYHGPGQRVAYMMVDLTKRGQDVRRYVCDLEQWVINTLDHFGIKGERREGRVGIWVVTPSGQVAQSRLDEAQSSRANQKEEKIAAIGVRVRKWVTYHGISINVNPDLSHFDGIVPCGLSQYGVTSFEKLGVNIGFKELDTVLQQEWMKLFS